MLTVRANKMLDFSCKGQSYSVNRYHLCGQCLYYESREVLILTHRYSSSVPFLLLATNTPAHSPVFCFLFALSCSVLSCRVHML